MTVHHIIATILFLSAIAGLAILYKMYKEALYEKEKAIREARKDALATSKAVVLGNVTEEMAPIS